MSLRDPTAWGKPWVLSRDKDKNCVSIPYNVLKDFGRQDIIVLDFLYRSYMKELSGIILNEEEDLNTQLQVSSFLGALYESLKKKFLVLVLCPDDLIIKWHYYMSKCSKLEVKIITSKTVPEDFDQEAGIVLLLSFTNIKLAEYLKEYDFISVVIDHFETIATKLVIRKLQGSFNIGITSRNFYANPDQKVQWTMLNWANPGSVGKLADFYNIDNDNFENYRDNYKEWWFRLTWDFCDTFVKPTLEEKGFLNNTLRDWGKSNHLPANLNSKSERRSNTRKTRVKETLEEIKETTETEDNKQTKRPRKVYKKTATRAKGFTKIPYKITAENSSSTKRKRNVNKVDPTSDSADSSDTIIYESNSVSNIGNDCIDTLDDDEPPIGASLKNNEISLKQFKKEQESDLNHSNDDDNDSVSSGEQLLCSLIKTRQQKSPRNSETTKKIDCQNEFQNFDESDLFLKSVATSSNDFAPLKNRQKTEKFFDKILEQSDDKTKKNALTQMEIELTEKDALDVPSESDSFFKGIFNNRKKNESSNRNRVKETKNVGESGNVSCANQRVDVDTLVAEVMEMVGKK